MHFYLDADTSPRLVAFLGSLGHGATHSWAVGRRYDTDDAQFVFAAQQGWPIVTHNTADYVLLLRAWATFAAHWSVAVGAHPGVLCINHQRGVPGDEDALRALLVGDEPPLVNRAYWYDNTTWKYLPSPSGSTWLPYR